MNIKKEIMEKAIKELEEIGQTAQFGYEFDCKALVKWLKPKLSQALTRIEEATRGEDRVKLINALERINSQCECIKGLTAISNEIDLISPSEEKECDCDNPHYIPGGSTLKGKKLDFGKKEKRGR